MGSDYNALEAGLGIAREVTWATPVAPTNWYYVVPGASLRMNRQQTPVNAFAVSGVAPQRKFYVPEFDRLDGSISVPLMYDNAGLLLEMLFGGQPTTTGAGPYLHEFVHSASMGESYTLELHRGRDPNTNLLVAEVFDGVKVDNITITAERDGGQPMAINFNGLMGEDSGGRVTAPTAKNFSASQPWILPHHISDLTFDGTAYCWRGMEISINNALAENPCFGSLANAESDRGGLLELFLTATLVVQDDLYTDWRSDTVAALSFSATGTGNNVMDVRGINAQVIDTSEPLAEGDFVVQTVQFALLGNSTQNGLEIDLTNDEASHDSNGS